MNILFGERGVKPDCVKVRFVPYWLNTERPEEAARYEEICAECDALGSVLMRCYAMGDTAYENMGPERDVEIETKHLFEDQWNTASDNAKSPELTGEELAELLPLYVTRQTTGSTSRNAQKLRQQREQVEKDFAQTTRAAKVKRDGLLWLMDHDISIDNVIYYSHTDKFAFGWRSPLDESVKSTILDVISEFPFEYEFATAK